MRKILLAFLLAAAASPGVAAGGKPRAYHLLIMGPPGVGKTTHAKRLAADFGMAYVSSGDLLRARAKTDKEIAERLKHHQLVPFPVVTRLVRERLSKQDARERGFILDGYPRRLEDAVALYDMLGELHVSLDAVIKLDVPAAEFHRRFIGRGGKEDTEDVFAQRMRIYREETAPVYGFLEGKLPVLTPDVTAPDPDLTYGNVRRAVESLAPPP